MFIRQFLNRFTLISIAFTILSLTSIAVAQGEPRLPGELPPNTPPQAAKHAEIEMQRQAELSEQRIEAAKSTGFSLHRTIPDGEQYSQAVAKELTELRGINPDDDAKYKNFLSSVNGGMFRLFPDLDCTTHFVLRTDGDCASFVEASSGYSFRSRSYNDNDAFNDIRLNQNIIIARGFFLSIGTIVSLGDIPIEREQLSDAALSFLVRLKTPKKYIDACEMASRLKDGFTVGNYTYSDSLKFDQNTTYALRVIAYKYPFGASPASSYDIPGFVHDSGNRTDIVVVFRGIRQDLDGSVTILWKELSRNKSKSISFGKYEKVGDFRPPTIRK